ncbi:type I restriction endonuclease, partial [Aliarcobacter butzleri]|nr:type I restriction endonuclease [Aliarcobacter butzleri]
MGKFTEEKLELAFIELLENQGINYQFGKEIVRNESEVLLEDDLKEYLKSRYKTENITDSEITQIVRKLHSYPASDLYDSNKSIMKLISDGFILKREKADDKDIYI